MDKKIVVKRIEALLTQYQEIRRKSKYDDLSDLHNDGLLSKFNTQTLATIDAIVDKNSAYAKQAAYKDNNGNVRPNSIPILVGILEALKADIEADYLWQINELIHADIFADFLEMARYLLNEGYKDAAAVLVGGVLEEHIRKLCIKNDIPVEIQKDQDMIVKKTDAMNGDLKRNNIYENLDHKNVTAWLDLRNKASHGKYNEYSKEQVQIMLTGVRDFVNRFPA